MGGFLILILAIAAVVAVIMFPELMGRSGFARAIRNIRYQDISALRSFSDVVDYLKNLFLPDSDLEQTAGRSNEPDLDVLNCRINETILKDSNEVINAFGVEICGSIHCPSDQHHATVKVSIQDVTEGHNSPKAVQAKVKQWQAAARAGREKMPETSADGHANSSDFSYNADLGKLPGQVTTLANWTTVARLREDWLIFPRKGKRVLLFNISILSAQDGRELAGARCTYIYDNPAFGFLDIPENIEHAKTLAVALAFAVSAADGRMYDCEIELIKKWAKDHINLSQASDKAEHKLDKALNEVITFFRQGNQFNSFNLCREIVEIAPSTQRYEAMDLCLHVAKAKGSVVSEELKFLKSIANWLEIDGGKFREMMDRIIPVEMHQVKDLESILGVTSDMDTEIARAHLNKQYIKWNARVTNTNPEIQSQADQMLKLIAEARTQYVPDAGLASYSRREQTRESAAARQQQQEENLPEPAAGTPGPTGDNTEIKPVKKSRQKVKNL